MQKLPITLNGLKNLEEERNALVNIERPAIISAISTARDLGDLSENAEYHSAREKQSFIEGRIQELNDIIARSEIIDPSQIKTDKIIFGATVHIKDLDTHQDVVYKIVGEHETNLEKGYISYNSPLGRELIGKKVEDIVDMMTSKGERSLEIIKIKYL